MDALQRYIFIFLSESWQHIVHVKDLSKLGKKDHFSIFGVLFVSIWDMSQTASRILCWTRKKWFSRIPQDSWQLMTPASCPGLTFAVNMPLTGFLMYIYGPGAVRLSPCFCLASFRMVVVYFLLFYPYNFILQSCLEKKNERNHFRLRRPKKMPIFWYIYDFYIWFLQ